MKDVVHVEHSEYAYVGFISNILSFSNNFFNDLFFRDSLLKSDFYKKDFFQTGSGITGREWIVCFCKWIF
jgi:hypothetical protein